MNQSTFIRPISGCNFDENTGKLYIFKPDSIRVMIAWPKPKAWIKTVRQPEWRQYQPKIRIPYKNIEKRIRRLNEVVDELRLVLETFGVSPKKINGSEIARLRWFQTIPQEIRDLIHPYREQWYLLNFIARCGDAARDLVISNPALAFALATNWRFHTPPVRRPLRSARTLLSYGKKQRDILSWLGFPGTKSSRYILSKIIPKSINARNLKLVRSVMNIETRAKAMSNLTRINTGAIKIVTDNEIFPMATPKLLEEISQYREEDIHSRNTRILQDIYTMFRLIYPMKKLPVFRSSDKIFDMYYTLIDSFSQLPNLGLDITFPPPPILGSDTIQPITTARELVKEGINQRNCSAAYLSRIINREFYFYRVKVGYERCTLSLVKRGSKWLFSECKRGCDLAPSQKIQLAVENWLLLNQREQTSEIEVASIDQFVGS